MPNVSPIEHKSWILANAGPTLLAMYEKRRLVTAMLPEYGIMPETLAKSTLFDVEFMIALLIHGAWISEDWQPYVRYTIAKRLKLKADELFDEVFESVRDDFLEFQLEGGTFKTQKRLKEFAVDIVRHPLSTRKHRIAANILISSMDDITLNTLIQPFHWIRLGVALSERDATFSMTLYTVEMARQKATLCAMLKAV